MDDVKYAGDVLRKQYYNVKGTLTLEAQEDWAQSRILISADPKHEYVIALEQTGANTYQIFTMSKNNEDSWNDWRLIESAAVNGNRNSIDFEVIVNGSQFYFLIEDEICYSSNRVEMTESTVKFTGHKKAKTTVENLDGEIFASEDEVETYAKKKVNFFGSANGLHTTDGVDLSGDYGANVGKVVVNTGGPKHLYVKNSYFADYYFETKVHVNEIFNEDGHPKFGLFAEAGATRISFFVDMGTDKTSGKVGRVISTHDGAKWSDNWGGSQPVSVEGMRFSGTD